MKEKQTDLMVKVKKLEDKIEKLEKEVFKSNLPLGTMGYYALFSHKFDNRTRFERIEERLSVIDSKFWPIQKKVINWLCKKVFKTSHEKGA